MCRPGASPSSKWGRSSKSGWTRKNRVQGTAHRWTTFPPCFAACRLLPAALIQRFTRRQELSAQVNQHELHQPSRSVMDYKTIQITREDGYAVVMLNRPHEM